MYDCSLKLRFKWVKLTISNIAGQPKQLTVTVFAGHAGVWIANVCSCVWGFLTRKALPYPKLDPTLGLSCKRAVSRLIVSGEPPQAGQQSKEKSPVSLVGGLQP